MEAILFCFFLFFVIIKKLWSVMSLIRSFSVFAVSFLVRFFFRVEILNN